MSGGVTPGDRDFPYMLADTPEEFDRVRRLPTPGVDDLAASMRRHPAGRALPLDRDGGRALLGAAVDEAAERAAGDRWADLRGLSIAAPRQNGRGTWASPALAVVSPLAVRAASEAHAREQYELARWCDDGGPTGSEPLPPLNVTLHADATALFRAFGDATRQVGNALRDMWTNIAAAWRGFASAWAWLTPRLERPVDRARRLRMERWRRARTRREARRQRQRARKAEPWRQMAAAGRRGAAGLDVLRIAADEALHHEATRYRLHQALGYAVMQPQSLVITTVVD